MKVVGQELPRVEILEKVTGQSVFGADVVPGGKVLHGKMVLSPHAHARITAIRTERAQRLPGVKAVVTAADVPAIRYGNFVRDEEYFARTKVRYVGDRIAAVAAVDEETAEEAAGLVEVDYEVLPRGHLGAGGHGAGRTGASRGLCRILDTTECRGPARQRVRPQADHARRRGARLRRGGPDLRAPLSCAHGASDLHRAPHGAGALRRFRQGHRVGSPPRPNSRCAPPSPRSCKCP